MKAIKLFITGVILCCSTLSIIAQELKVEEKKNKQTTKLEKPIEISPMVAPTVAPEPKPVIKKTVPDTLVVLWSSDNKEVFTKMVYIYALNAKRAKWWDEVIFIVWGPSAVLLAEDEEVQKSIEKMHEIGIDLEACLWCTNEYNVTEAIKNMQIDVKYMGTQLTKYLKSENHEVITF